MLRLFDWVARRARRSPNAYSILAGLLLAVAVPMYALLIALTDYQPLGVPAVDMVLGGGRIVVAKTGPALLVCFWVGIGLILAGAVRYFTPRDGEGSGH